MKCFSEALAVAMVVDMSVGDNKPGRCHAGFLKCTDKFIIFSGISVIKKNTAGIIYAVYTDSRYSPQAKGVAANRYKFQNMCPPDRKSDGRV